ncbi:MAG: tetratricopeptide repeat protein [Tannerellaceae bacterium]|nr:tetratricopeptide repeat protein [Tannerellaceae bacterium]
MRSTFLIGFICVLCSCTTISYMGIETYNPAEITFPDPVKKILIVNNAVPQPPELGYTYSLGGVNQDTCRAYADSALFAAAKTLGESIVEHEFFEDVLLYHLPIRTDDLYFSDQKLTAAQVNRLCRENGVDAIISIDRLLFNMHKSVTSLMEGYAYGQIDVKMNGIIRSYLPGKENPLATVHVQDSVQFSLTAGSRELLNEQLPPPNKILELAAIYLADNLYPNFVPFWKEEERWFFNGGNTLWREASAFAGSGRWEKAYERWEQIYNRTGSWKDKAKTASNMALYHEINGDMEEAQKKAEEAYQLFLTHKGEKDEQTQRQETYKNILSQRAHKDMKLDIQFGKP